MLKKLKRDEVGTDGAEACRSPVFSFLTPHLPASYLCLDLGTSFLISHTLTSFVLRIYILCSPFVDILMCFRDIRVPSTCFLDYG